MSFNPRNPGAKGSQILGSHWGTFASPDEFKPGNREEAARVLSEQMVAISGDASGSDPKDYVSRVNAAKIAGFARLAIDCGGAGSVPVNLLVPKNDRFPVWKRDRAWNNPNNPLPRTPEGKNRLYRAPDQVIVAKAGLTKALFLRQEGPTQRAYQLPGVRLSTGEPAQPVAICIDEAPDPSDPDRKGTFRSERGAELAVSYGLGWGRLPDADLVRPVRIPGQLDLVNFTNAKSLSLTEQLVSMIPASARQGVDLADYGLNT